MPNSWPSPMNILRPRPRVTTPLETCKILLAANSMPVPFLRISHRTPTHLKAQVSERSTKIMEGGIRVIGMMFPLFRFLGRGWRYFWRLTKLREIKSKFTFRFILGRRWLKIVACSGKKRSQSKVDGCASVHVSIFYELFIMSHLPSLSSSCIAFYGSHIRTWPYLVYKLYKSSKL